MPSVAIIGTKPSVAIIGTEACGKTVFVTTLAKRLTTPDNDGVFIEPLDRRTTAYVEKAWNKLCDCDWPPFTTQGELNSLEWSFHAGHGMKCNVRLVDCAGHDLRVLFADEQIDQLDTLPDALKKVAEYCREADIVIFMVNLGDFLLQGDEERLTANEWAIKYSMDYVRRGNGHRHCCLVFTQADRYTQLEREYCNWNEVAKKFLPHVHAAHLHSGSTPVFPVAAVADTNERLIRGQRRVVPALKFESRGLETVVSWLADCTRSVIARQDAEAQEKKRAEQQKRQQEELEKRQREIREKQEREAKERMQEQDRRRQLSERRNRVLKRALPLAIIAFAISLMIFSPASNWMAWHLAPVTEEHPGGSEKVPIYREDPVFEDQPNFVTVPVYKDVTEYETVSDSSWYNPLSWGSTKQVPTGITHKEKDGEKVEQRGTKKVQVGTTKVQTGTEEKQLPPKTVTVGVSPSAWFWFNVFAVILSVLMGVSFLLVAFNKLSQREEA